MGLIRLLLALSIIGAHSNSNEFLKLVGGEVAVEVFFIISGFYMAMVYNNYSSKLNFWFSRFLRLYPTYIFCAIFTFFFLKNIPEYVHQLKNLPILANIFLCFTNLTILFQDLVMFLGVNSNEFYFTKNFGNSTPPLYQLLLLPQGWSLGLEVSFYLLVPFIFARSNKFLFGLIILSFLTRLILWSYGFTDDPWSYRFFPIELSMFLLGSLAFRISKNQLYKLNTNLIWIIFITVILWIIFFPMISMDYQYKKIILYLMIILSLNSIFNIFKNSRIDNFLGMLSYPIYCCHLIVLSTILPKFHFWRSDGTFSNTLFSYLIVVLMAAIIYIYIERPIDKYRSKYKNYYLNGNLKNILMVFKSQLSRFFLGISGR